MFARHDTGCCTGLTQKERTHNLCLGRAAIRAYQGRQQGIFGWDSYLNENLLRCLQSARLLRGFPGRHSLGGAFQGRHDVLQSDVRETQGSFLAVLLINDADARVFFLACVDTTVRGREELPSNRTLSGPEPLPLSVYER